jgi:peroxidase
MYSKTILSISFSLLLGMTLKNPVHAQQTRYLEGNEANVIGYNRLQPTVKTLSVVPRSKNRSYDGTNNNISGNNRLVWGSANIPLFREMGTSYGSSDNKNALSGPNRPSARRISNALSDEPVTNFNSRGLSSFVYIWGQFLDHDISLTPTDTIEYVPITLPSNEVLFTEEIPFYRSAVRPGTGVTNARQQTNLNTSWIDASNVYGSDSVTASWLRTHQDGKMKTSAGDLLPYNTTTGELADPIDPNAPTMANDAGHTVKTFAAGDVRAAEHPGLTAMHTLFIREHNRICTNLVAQGQTDDELIYQRARKEVGALIQAITYQEFLPAVGVTLGPYVKYDSKVRPDIMNNFATAGYRIGHTMVADDILLRDDDCEEVVPGEFDLVTVFWNTALLPTYGVEPFFKGFAVHTQYETDTKVNSVLRNMLFGSPTDPVRFGIDLASLNIQRGRDHGLPNYNKVRQFYTGTTATSFSDISSIPAIADSIQSLYGGLNNIDLWVGILAEDRLPGKSVGLTMHAMLKAQFEKLRDGDFYFYLHDPYLRPNSRNQIVNTTFADVLIRNTTLTNLQANVFFTEECPGDTAEERATSVSGLNATYNLYPNPVSSQLNIRMENTGGQVEITLYSVTGQLLKTVTAEKDATTQTISMKEYKDGMYLIQIRNANEIKSFRFIKQSD